MQDLCRFAAWKTRQALMAASAPHNGTHRIKYHGRHSTYLKREANVELEIETSIDLTLKALLKACETYIKH